MLVDDAMPINERRQYLKKMWPRYLQADRAGRSHLLTEMEHITGMHRKSLIRLLKRASLERRKRTTPRRRSYGLDVEQVVHSVWERLDYLCAERLTPCDGYFSHPALIPTELALRALACAEATPY